MANKVSEKNIAVYSFNGAWAEKLTSGDVSVFFRKKIPVSCPTKIYLYAGTPVGKILGWAATLEAGYVSVDQAISLSKDAAIDKEYLKKYIGSAKAIGAIKISSPIIFQNPPMLADLRRKINFFAPQNFTLITDEVADTINEMGK